MQTKHRYVLETGYGTKVKDLTAKEVKEGIKNRQIYRCKGCSKAFGYNIYHEDLYVARTNGSS